MPFSLPLRVSLYFPSFVFLFRTHRSHHFENDVEHGQAGEEDEVGAGEGLVFHRGGEEHFPPTLLAREGRQAGGASRWGRVSKEGEERVRSLEKGKGEFLFKMKF